MVHMTKKTKTSGSVADFWERWDHISTDVARAFRMSEDEAKAFAAKPIARLIAAIPFAAGCEDAERTAVAHLGTYILSVRETKHYFNAMPMDDEDILERFRLISSFKGGDQAVIRKGMSLLALNMLNDYKRDAHIDMCLGKYNPLVAGCDNYEATRQRLQKDVEAVPAPMLDAIAEDADDPVTNAYWGWG